MYSSRANAVIFTKQNRMAGSAFNYAHIAKIHYDAMKNRVSSVISWIAADTKSDEKRGPSIGDPMIASGHVDERPRTLWRRTMRVDRKDASRTVRRKCKNGSPFKNWIIHGKYGNLAKDIVMRCTHATWSALRADTWYDFEVTLATTGETRYWVQSFRENSRTDKIEMLKTTGLYAEIGCIILEYAFPTDTRMPVRESASTRLQKIFDEKDAQVSIS